MRRFAAALCLLALVAGAAAEQCTAGGATGTCKDVDTCAGTRTSGLCSGAANIQCCTNEQVNCGPVNGQTGVCLNENQCTDGTTVAGLCSGPAAVKCCVTNAAATPPDDGGNTPPPAPSCPAPSSCRPESTCVGTTRAGLCPGPANIKCCTPSNTAAGPDATCWSGSYTYTACCKGAYNPSCWGRAGDGSVFNPGRCCYPGDSGATPPAGTPGDVGGGTTPGTPAAGNTASPAAGQNLNENGLNVIKHFESWFPNCYIDTEGIWTIGYGHACHVNNDPGPVGCKGNNVCRGPITRAQGTTYLRQDMAKFVKCVQDNVRVPLTANQFGALVSFSFNVGCKNFRDSTLLRNLNNNRDYAGVPYQLSRWHSDCTRGLMRRRYEEGLLWNSNAANGAFPCTEAGCPASNAYKNSGVQCGGVTCQYATRCLGASTNSLGWRGDEADDDAEVWHDLSLPADEQPPNPAEMANNLPIILAAVAAAVVIIVLAIMVRRRSAAPPAAPPAAPGGYYSGRA
eukprot:PLAT6518.1.p1 GENE.PLAT6518.1~~PLAT6518.1.p1  ORF type:complete len:511 (+),score=202.35 PLAT6518.1:30-1562(+)